MASEPFTLTFTGGDKRNPALVATIGRYFKDGNWMDPEGFGEAISSWLQGIDKMDACGLAILQTLAHAVIYASLDYEEDYVKDMAAAARRFVAGVDEVAAE